MSVYLLIAYTAIIGGGLLITRRLHLLALAGAFWVTLAIGLGLLAGSGHCMTANWAFAPVCGVDYWRVIMTSPELLIFLFFMITDPKTVPAGRVGRVVFGVLVAVASVLLMAPQTDEFGTKVGLLAGLVVLCAARPLLDRVLPEPRSGADAFGGFIARLGGGSGAGVARRAAGIGAAVVAVLVVGAGIVAAGTPARGVVVPNVAEALNRGPGPGRPGDAARRSPSGQDVLDFDPSLAGAGMRPGRRDAGPEPRAREPGAPAARPGAAHRRRPRRPPRRDAGRLATRRSRRDRGRHATTTSTRSTSRCSCRSAEQTGLSLGLDASGTMVEETYDAAGALRSRRTSPFAKTFAMRRATGARWLNVAVLPPAQPGG